MRNYNTSSVKESGLEQKKKQLSLSFYRLKGIYLFYVSNHQRKNWVYQIMNFLCGEKAGKASREYIMQYFSSKQRVLSGIYIKKGSECRLAAHNSMPFFLTVSVSSPCKAQVPQIPQRSRNPLANQQS